MAKSPANKGFGAVISDAEDAYLTSVFKPEDMVLQEIRQSIIAANMPQISVGGYDGLHLEVLARMRQAKKIVEIGTLGGYSAVCLARALPADGVLYTFEFSAKHAAVAQENFKRAGVADKVRLFVGPALEKLSEIESVGPFDLVFIDADKVNYPNYLSWAAQHLKLGGVVLGDNTLAWGMLTDTTFENEHDAKNIQALRQFNEALASPAGVFRATLLPTAEGLSCGVKVK